MEYYVGLDVSLKQTSICVVDQTGSVVREGVVDSDPEAISVYVKRIHCLQKLQLYSITSSARARSDGGTSIPSDFAVLRLMVSKNLVGCSIGSSDGLAPLRIRSTKGAPRRPKAR